ncbi:amino acid adenylation domain-containing protein [Moorena producens]|uniref:amino acid adenylation domain-containing protein n=1 Tax=Moorena producens TaxID=1155739 RepID=UPI003C716715
MNSQELIESLETGGYTPSDFPLAQLSQTELDSLLTLINYRNLESIYPLSPMQEGMLFESLYAPESGVYVEQLLLKVGYLQVDIWEQAWQQVVQRHSVLRTFIIWEDRQQPLQVVLKHVDWSWQHQDWRDLSVTEQQQQLEALLVSDRQQRFALNHPPLMRWYLIRLEDESYQLVWSFHHILLDGRSLQVIFQELLSLYQSSCQGQSCTLAPVTPYRDYIGWLQQQQPSQAEVFWRENLQGFTASTPLVVDRTPSQQQQQPSSYQELECYVEASVTAALQSKVKQHHLTLSTVVQAAWALLLSRYSGESEVMFGVTVFGRQASFPGVETIVGLLMNTLPLRVKVPTEAQLIPWLEQLHSQQVELEEYSFSHLVEIQKCSEVPAGVPLFESIVFFENYPLGSLLQEDLIQPLEIEQIESFGQTNYPLTVIGIPEERLRLKIYYDCHCFEAETINRMLGHLQTLLAGIVTNPQSRLGELPLLTAQEEQQLLIEWNQTATDYPASKCIQELFEEQVERTPEAVAVVFEEEQVSYRQLNQRANQLAHYLQTLGVGPEVLVGICVERSVEMVVGLLGILKAGGAYVPLDPSYPQQRLAYMLSEAAVPVLLTQESLVTSLPENCAQIVNLDSDWDIIARESQKNILSGITSENLAYVIFTSGSTGTPKGVMISHQAIANQMSWMQTVFPLTKEDKVLQKTPFGFDASIWEFYAPLLAGAQLVMARPGGHQDSAYLIELIAQHQVTILQVVPSLLQMLLATEGFERCQSLRRVFCGGEALPTKLVEQLSQILPVEIYNLYGPTEATINTTCFKCEQQLYQGSAPLGRPISNMKLYILDRHRQPVPIGVPGELHIGGACLARGYLNRPELTAEKFIPNPFGQEKFYSKLYKTGDLVRYLRDGNIEFLGRIDHQVKLIGFRIELGEIESLLSNQEQVEQAVVIVREDTPGNKKLVAYLVSQSEVDINQLRDSLQQQLPEYMIPSAWVVLDSLPLSPNGKVDRKALPTPEIELTEGELVAPRTASEEIIANIFASVLGVKAVGIYDNFFALGGHSLLATQVISRLRQALQVELPLRSLFEAPSVAQLDLSLRQQRSTQEGLNVPLIVSVASNQEPLPLSFAQEGLWFLEQLYEQGIVYNLPSVFRLRGSLNREALSCSLKEIVRRHQALRTNFHLVNNQLVQVVRSATDWSLPFLDLSRLEPEQRALEVKGLAELEANQPFQLESDYLLRAKLIQETASCHVLLLTIHHISFDDWSMRVLVEELNQLYLAYAQGQPSPLAELDIQYRDFAIWQRKWLSAEVLNQLQSYWQQQLADLPLLELPTDRPRPGVQTFRGANLPLEVPVALTEKLRELTQTANATLYISLLAVFVSLLNRYTGQEDIVVGLPIANRNRKELEPLIGFFVNTLVLRVDLSTDPSFEELLGQVRRLALEAYEHQDMPFEELVAELQPERDLSRNPLVQVIFTLQNAPREEWQLQELNLSLVNSEVQMVQFDLEVHLWEVEEGLKGVLAYSTDLFDKGTIKRMWQHYLNLLQAIVTNPQQPVSRLPLLTAQEQQQLLVEWNQTAREYPTSKCLQELFEEQVERTPEVVAVVFEQQQLSYRQLNQRANQLAHYLQKLGVRPEVLVGICVERSVEMIVGLLGILKAGGAYVPLDPNYPAARLVYMLSDAGVSVLLTQESLLSSLPESTAQIVSLDTDWERIGGESEENPVSDVSPENLAYVIYTSGSTGKPKGVAIAHGSLVNLMYWQQQQGIASPEAKTLQFAPISFDVSCQEIFSTWCTGGTLVLVSEEIRRDSFALIEYLVDYQIEKLFVPFVVLQQLAAVAPHCRNLPQLAEIITAGEQLQITPELLELSRRLPDCRVQNQYGPSESHVVSAYSLEGSATTWPTLPPIGRPIANTQLYILDKNMQPLPIGVPGELHIGGVGLARGYLNRRELTQEKFVPNPFSEKGEARLYKTGDLARYRPDGTIEFLGRLDEQVKVRGFRIELGEIETVLSQHPQVTQAVVAVKGEKASEKRLVGYIVLREQELIPSQELGQFLKEQLPEYMVPSTFVVLDKLPLTPSGKVNRKALPVPELEWKEGEFVPPRNQVERQLVEIWSAIFNLSSVGVRDNFFDLGGHSLLAVPLISRIREQFGKELSLGSIFQNPTIEQLATTLHESRDFSFWSTLLPIQTQGSKIPFFCVSGGIGSAFYLQMLARHLGSDQPFYGLQAVGLDGQSEPHTRIEDMAADYIEAIKSVQTEGPYLLGGHSSGGHVAFEMAQQLQKQGDQVALLVIIDISAPDHSYNMARSQFTSWDDATYIVNLAVVFEQLFEKELEVSTESLQTLCLEEQISYFSNQLQKHGVLPPEAGIEQVRGLINVYKATFSMSIKYLPQEVYRTPILLFKRSDEFSEEIKRKAQFKKINDPENMKDSVWGWGQFADGAVALDFVPGNHVTMMREPNVQVLAEKLRACLARVKYKG